MISIGWLFLLLWNHLLIQSCFKLLIRLTSIEHSLWILLMLSIHGVWEQRWLHLRHTDLICHCCCCSESFLFDDCIGTSRWQYRIVNLTCSSYYLSSTLMTDVICASFIKQHLLRFKCRFASIRYQYAFGLGALRDHSATWSIELTTHLKHKH